MTGQSRDVFASMLREELRWIMQLRWAAAATVVLLGMLHALLGPLFEHKVEIIAVGLAMLAWNTCFALAAPRRRNRDGIPLALVAWAHLGVDLVCLTLLTLWTGGALSPLLPLYVIHMVFASVLLPRVQAFVVSLLAVALLALGLPMVTGWPTDPRQRVILLGWAVALPLSVYVVNRITRELFRLEHERLRTRGRLRKMRRRLDAQQRAMVQHEKLVSMGQLAAGVAHEISNPLAGMDGLLQLMARHPDKPRPEAIATLREQVARIQATVRHLTGMAHPDLGQTEAVDANALVRDVLDTLRFDHRLRKVHLSLELDEATGSAQIVARAMHQVLINLVFNALDAMEGKPDATLVLRTKRERDWCLIEVEDNGQGIPSAAWDRVFRPFYTTKPVGKGTGLGLSISRGLVRGQGGELTFRSEVGKRTTFSVRVPAATGVPASLDSMPT
ncbi:MAG: HAMP domain-containing histidine kinase [Phycisphaerales bacterium]|nr:HAMP domain-containing histidine kinase [Phycisphaerales bacterium]